jgi:hypothetical protein
MLPPRFFRSRRQNVLRVLTNVVTVLVTLELLTRFCLPDLKNGLQFDPEIGYREASHVDKMVHSNESGLNFRYRTNSLGFRGNDWSKEKSADVRRVAVFGHSFTHGMSYPEEQTFCGLLEQRLNDAGTPFEWDVMNCGFSGCNLIAQFRAYGTLIKARNPDLVICCFAVSNNVTSNSVRFRSPKWPSAEFGAMGELVIHPASGRTGHDLRNKSRFHVWQKHKVQAAIDRIRDPLRERGILPDDGPAEHAVRESDAIVMSDTRPGEDVLEAWNVTAGILRRFRDSVEETGAEFVLVSIPMAWQVYPDLYESERSQAGRPDRYEWDDPRRRLHTMLDELSIQSLDLVPSFRKACPSQSIAVEDEWLYLHGDGHFNAAGHQLVAEELSRYLLEILPAGTPEPTRPRNRKATLEPLAN